jgi:spore germination protein
MQSQIIIQSGKGTLERALEGKRMNEKKNELLTSGQTMGLLVGFAIGPEFLKLPNLMVKTAGQNGWISAAIAIVYPLYVVLIASVIIKKHPRDNLLIINKKYFGKVIGNILNFIFMLQFIVYTSSIVSEFDRIARVYIVGFLTTTKIIFICLCSSVYAATRGIKTLGKISEATIYFIIAVLVITVTVFQEGSVVNIKPVFENGFSRILGTAAKTFYFYTGFEALLLIHPFAKDAKTIRASALKAVILSGFIWVWSVFATIYYLGIDIIPHKLWSFFMVFDSVNLPIINNVRYIFMFVWALVSYRIVANYIFLSSFIIEDLTKLNFKKVCYFLIPVIFYITILFGNEILRSKILDILSPFYVSFNLILISVLAIIIKIKTRVITGENYDEST